MQKDPNCWVHRESCVVGQKFRLLQQTSKYIMCGYYFAGPFCIISVFLCCERELLPTTYITVLRIVFVVIIHDCCIFVYVFLLTYYAIQCRVYCVMW